MKNKSGFSYRFDIKSRIKNICFFFNFFVLLFFIVKERISDSLWIKEIRLRLDF